MIFLSSVFLKTNIKIRCYLDNRQENILGNYLFSSQLFRNFAVDFLKKRKKVQKTLALAERVNGGKTGKYSSFVQISHGEILAYISGFYPIDNVLMAIEQNSKKVVSKKGNDCPETKPCGQMYHPVFSKLKRIEHTERRAG